MKREGFKQNALTFASVLKGIAKLGDVNEGRQVHAFAFGAGLMSDVIVGSALISMYAKVHAHGRERCCLLDYFDNCISPMQRVRESNGNPLSDESRRSQSKSIHLREHSRRMCEPLFA
ncbi:Pentatricopeptide repeat-containing protein [Acorus calamus]|uniref:Pentatricopeptide repeat-containing protein n=1 Tax=Acorus calamus TaxID=4465 RepID=A0AAV9EER9_ACOCL|nr:Pentatricopeptide repeat-containing protein [Acorus calamus]